MRRYLDNAATSFPKPPVVWDAVDRYQRDNGAPAGRGTYREAVQVRNEVDRCRQLLAELFQTDHSSGFAFTANGTTALNWAIHGLLCPGDHVLTTELEHNSVLRPLRWHEQHNDVRVTRLSPNSRGQIEPKDVAGALTSQTRLVVMTHASNVTGIVQPIEEIAEIVRKSSAAFLVDAAQSAGHLPILLKSTPIDLLACSGHKGLLGPLGTGVLWIRPEWESKIRTSVQGGTGSNSDRDDHPETVPEKWEAGNLNVPGIVGLARGIEFVLKRTVAEIHRHEQELRQRLVSGLKSISSVKVFSGEEDLPSVGVLSFQVASIDSHELAMLLDTYFQIQVRAGLHCAPRIHRLLGTNISGGTVRVGFGPFNTCEDVDCLVAAVRELTESFG